MRKALPFLLLLVACATSTSTDTAAIADSHAEIAALVELAKIPPARPSP